MSIIRRFLRDERGLELPEYAVMTALIIAAVVGAIAALATAISGRFQTTADTVTNPAP